ncbi:hypothetical protein GCM10027275_18910 [Rhabdobacter roseus]|uniref:Voltage-gated potassium channel n=1 Tax=Rhabdobacter roseus TaxID=1655419 RepID=A0A840TI27_9BACT|nr:ion transporter [Rhabdobacter roseus]MBB5283816.1 voltage-gated potassium channel [Rhabdobacter roseus]
MQSTLRKKIHQALTISRTKNHPYALDVNLFIFGLIFLNSLAIILYSVPSIQAYPHAEEFFYAFEVFSVSVFSLEYLLRLWSCVEDARYRHPIRGRIKFVFSAWSLIDLLAIVPFYLSFFTAGFGLIRILRILRLIRLIRFSRYSQALNMIRKAIEYTKEELVLSFTFVLFAVLIASSIIYYLENPVQPELFPSIPASIWWGIVTMTTVGYGDVYPITNLGKIFGGLIAVMGIALFSLPTGIFASGFLDQINQRKKGEQKKMKCPHCGEEIHEEAETHH